MKKQTRIFLFCCGMLFLTIQVLDARSRVAQDKTGFHKGFIIHQGRMRTYIVHVPPAYNGATSLPLVFVLHGGGGNNKNVIDQTGFNKKADAEGIIAVYPNGTGKAKNRFLTWNGESIAADLRIPTISTMWDSSGNCLINSLRNTASIQNGYTQPVYRTAVSCLTD